MPIRITTVSWENPEKKIAPIESKLAALSKRYPELKGLSRGKTTFVSTKTIKVEQAHFGNGCTKRKGKPMEHIKYTAKYSKNGPYGYTSTRT